LRNARFRDDPEPLDASMGLPCSNAYSRAYIHHLLKAGEILGMQILAQHNVAMMARLMQEIRAGIASNTLEQLQKEWIVD
jgi:queuine tRNA-ribosyltransferase